MSISEDVRIAGGEIASSQGADIAVALNKALDGLIGWPYRIASGSAIDSDGAKSAIFGTIIHTQAGEGGEIRDVPADNLAAVIDVIECIDIAQFQTTYQRIAQAKSLKKSPAAHIPGTPHTTRTLGVILANTSKVPLEQLAQELDRLNQQTPDFAWPDMVAVLSTGCINYAVQFPGEPVSADYLPPAEGAIAAYTPPMYIVLLMKPTRTYTFNRMLAFLIAHLAIFSPGAKLPEWLPILENAPKDAVTICGYQYNLSGKLLPVPRQFYNDRYLAPLPMRIEDKKGTLLSTIQFLPWQDGGAILLRGKLPLDGLLIFLGKEPLARAGIVKRPGGQISYVLPINQQDFARLAARIEQQSNMIVKKQSPNWTIQKFADEGSTSPVMARLFIGITQLRDAAFPDPADRDRFDKPYEFVMTALLSAREAAKELGEKWREHGRKVSNGEVAKMQGQSIRIEENVDRELRKLIDNFLNTSVRALKQGMPNVTTAFQVNIGFLFQKPNAFANGLAALEKLDAPLAAYLREARVWTGRLLESRNAIEHESWTLPRVTYSHNGGSIEAHEPSVSGQRVSGFATQMLDRLLCLVEELTAHCLQSKMPGGISITQIPLSERESVMPVRFRVTLASGGMPVWKIADHPEPFEQS